VILDIFRNDAFSAVELTTAMNWLPYVPSRIGSMGLFTRIPVRQRVVGIEARGDVIAILPTKHRRARETTKRPTTGRNLRHFEVPYIPLDDLVLASDVAGIREFGTEDQLETVSGEVNRRLEHMRQLHEITHEYHRLGALKGIVYDADGTTELLNLFTEFSISPTEVYFDLDNEDSNIKALVKSVIRHIEGALQGSTYTGVHALAGDNFYDMLTQHPKVVDAMVAVADVDQRWLVENQGTGTPPLSSFQYGGVTWENYRGRVGDVDFIDTDEVHFFPTGVPNLFVEHFAPADTMEFVNTLGQPTYAMQAEMKFNEGVELHTESNPLMVCTRPTVLVKGFVQAPST
jgi:hypothetical protein